MLITINLVTRLSETAQVVQYEHLRSSKNEVLYGAAPDQEEKEPGEFHRNLWCHVFILKL